MAESRVVGPDRSSIGSAALRAMHVQVDPPPHVLVDELGLRLAVPDGSLHVPPGMEPAVTARLRASIVARARFIEDLVAEQAHDGVHQYVILGAGLDTFAERRQDLASRLHVFEVDQPGPQAWKRQRLIDLGFGIPSWLRLVPVDFEQGASWWDGLLAAGFEADQPAIIASTGVSMYLTQEAITTMLHRCAGAAPGSTLVMSFLVPLEEMAPDDRPRESTLVAPGTWTGNSFRPDEMVALARDAAFQDVQCVSAAELTDRYLSGRPDGLQASSYQALLIAKT